MGLQDDLNAYLKPQEATAPVPGSAPAPSAPSAGGGEVEGSPLKSSLNQYLSGKYASPSPAPPTAPPPAATQEVKPLAAPVQPPQPAVTQEVQPGTPPSTPVSPAAQPSLVGVKSSAPVNLPEALAPSPQPVTAPVKGSEDKPLYVKAWDELNRFAAAGNKAPVDVFHGLAKGLDDLISYPGRIASGDWKSPTPAYASKLTGAIKEIYAPEKMIDEAHPVTRFLGELFGGLEAYMMPGGISTKIATKALPEAPLMQKLLSNLITFSSTDAFQTAGAGGNPEQVRNAFLKALPTSVLFTVAQALPFDKMAKNPWMQKALESTATGTAFAGSHVMGGNTDPAGIATSFLTGFFLHALQGGIPRKAGLTPEERQKALSEYFDKYTVDWKETNQVNAERWAPVQKILDDIKQEAIRPVEPGKPILDQFGQPVGSDKAQAAMSDPETQAALAKPSWQRNAHEKLLADQVEKQAKESLQSPGQTPASEAVDIIPGEPGYRERANVTEPSVERLQRAVDVVGDSAAGKKLGDLLAGNQEDLANAFRVPGDAQGIPEITDKIMDLAQKVEDTGDPGAAKELHDFINSNLGALKGLPRWPAGGTQPVTPAPPMATAGHVSEDLGTTPAPKAAEPPTPDSSSLPGAAAKGPDISTESKSSAAPAITGGDMTEVLGAKPVAPAVEPPAPTIASTENVPSPAPGEVAPDSQAGKEIPDPLQAAKDFRATHGSRQGAPEGLLTGGERTTPGERTDPDTPGVSFHDNFPRDQITVNADLWQHKLAETGAGQALAHIKNKSEWSKLGAGDLAVYRFPDGHVELMDGHSRINAGDRVGLDGHKVMVFDGNTYSVEEARATAALVNIMHETGTSVDSAKAIRDLALTIEDLQQKGVKLSSKHTEVALGLSKLSDRIFADVAMGKFPDTKGAIIGQLLPGNLEAQDAVYNLILKKHADKNGDIRISDEKLRNDIRFAEFSKVVPTNQPILGDVFAESMKENLVSENSDLKTYAERKLANEKNLFKTVNNKAKQLVEAGNKLKPAVNQKISDDAAIGLAVLDIAPFVTGTETNKLFKEFAAKLQESSDKTQVKDEFYARLPEALEADRDAAGLGKSVERTVRGEKPPSAPPGEHPEGGGRKFSVEEAFGLNPQDRPLSKFEKRLEEILRAFPDADPVKASMALRGQPKATDEQIAQLAALTPAERDQVARGNLAATERQQLLKKASDAGAQGDLFGGGGRGGDTLFKAGEEATFTRGLTTEQIQGRLSKYGTVSELAAETFPANSPYARGWTMRLKNGQMAMVFEAKDGSLQIGPGDTLGPDYSALGITSLEGKTIAGSFKPVSFGSFVELAKGQGIRVFDHESWHHIEHWLLNDKERAAVIKQFGDNEEVRAEAYAHWNPKEAPNTIFQKILDFFQRITKALTGKVTGEDVFAAARSGEMFGRQPVERGLPEALAPIRMKAEDIAKPELSKALSQGKLTLEDYDARYADKYGEWGSSEWANNFPDFAAMGVRMAREDGTVVSERKYRVEEGGEWGMEGGLAGKVTGNIKAAREEGKAAKNWLMSLFASSRTSPEALKTHQVIAGSQAESATEKLRMQNVFQKYVEGLGPIKGEATQEFLRLYEHGQEDQVNHPLFKAFGEEFRAEERRHMEIMTMLGDAPKEIPNYIDHLWKQNEAAEQIKAQLMAQVSGGRSMRGPDYFKLLRTVVDIPSGIAAGLDPKFDTLPEMVLAGRSARENRIAATKRLKFVKENGYEKVVRDMDGGTFTVEGADGTEKTFKSINEARAWAKDNPGSSEPRFEPNVPQGWKVYPGGYGEVWTKVQRRAGAMIPERADEEVLPMGGGPERSGYEEVPKVDAWTRVGHRVGPEEVVRQFEDFLGRGLSGNSAFEVYQSALHAARHSQMALSFFHAFAESINSMATHAGEGLSESLGGLFTGDWRRMGGGLKTLAGTPLAPFTDIKGGISIDKELMKHGVGIPGEATDNALLKDARDLVGGGHRPRAETDLIKILSTHFKEAFKLKGDLALGKRGNELLQGLSSPTMEIIVPFAKGGSNYFKYQAEVRRWERAHPGETPTKADLSNISYEVRDLSDAIFGQMAKDNVGMNATLKSLLTGVLQFPTWQFGTVKAGVRSMIGAKDVVGKVFDMMQGKEIRQLAMKDRMAMQYVAGLIFTVGMTGALMHYALTGKKPETMADYFFPKTGEINPNGSEERLQLPSYFKDAMGVSHHPFQTIGAKLASPIHILTDLIQNKDYWGNQVYDPHDWVGQRGIDVLKYMAKTTAPFALQSYEQGAKQTPGRAAMSLFGVRPVPREYSNTPASNVIDEYNQMVRASTTTKESAETKKLKGDLMKMARDQDEAGFQEAAGQAVSEGKITRQQVKEIVTESQAPPGVSRFTRLPLEWATRAYDAGSDYEKEQWKPYFLKKVMTEKPENLIKNREAVVDTLKGMGLDEAADAVANLVMPEEPVSGIDLTGLGIQKASPEMGGMEGVDTAIAQALEQNLKGKEKPTRVSMRSPSIREKKNKFEILGL